MISRVQPYRTALLTFMMAVIMLLFFSGCGKKESNFQHGFAAAGAVPWLSDQFDNAEDKFTFGIVTDLTGGERPGIFSIAVEQLNLLRPELIITVGAVRCPVQHFR